MVIDRDKYRTLFDFFYLLEAIEEGKGRESLTDGDFARTLLSHAINNRLIPSHSIPINERKKELALE